jgi:Bacterial PH domain
MRVVSNAFVFRPPVQRGYLVHLAAILVLLAAAGLSLWQAFTTDVGPAFITFLLPGILASGLAILFGYRAYALRGAFYALERDGFRLHWGLRTEVIPINAITWVGLAGELGEDLPLPALRWPGSILGTRHLSGLGPIEFMASLTSDLVLIITRKRVYAISPEDPLAFLQAFQRLTELGSLSPLKSQSIYPTFFLARVWESRLARGLILAGLSMVLFTLVWTSLSVSGHRQILMGFDLNGQPRDLVPGVRLMLLPVLSSIVFLVDLLLGLFFFREEENRLLAYLLWAGGVLAPFLFLMGVFYILGASYPP